MDGAQVGVLEETDEVGLGGFLERTDGLRLEPQVGLEVLRNLSDETLERKLSDQEFSRLLEPSDLTESDGARSVSVRLLDSALQSERRSRERERRGVRGHCGNR